MPNQYEPILAVKRWAFKQIKQIAKKAVFCVGGNTPETTDTGNLVLLQDHPAGLNKIQDNYMSKQLIMKLRHQNPNVYSIQPINVKVPMHMLNQCQLFDPKSPKGILIL